jgi:hypothetical protein
MNTAKNKKDLRTVHLRLSVVNVKAFQALS